MPESDRHVAGEVFKQKAGRIPSDSFQSDWIDLVDFDLLLEVAYSLQPSDIALFEYGK